MSCRRVSLLTNRTRAPWATVSSFGVTTPFAIVNTLVLAGGCGWGDGVVPPPPHAAKNRQARTDRVDLALIARRAPLSHHSRALTGPRTSACAPRGIPPPLPACPP